MMSYIITRSTAASGGSPFRLKKCTALTSAATGFCGAYSSWVTGYDQSFLSLWRRNLGSQSAAKYGSIDDLFKCRPSLRIVTGKQIGRAHV